MKKILTTTLSMLMCSTTILMAQPSKKILVAYFSFPEQTEADASSGASRLISDNRMYGTTEYVANIIANATTANIFEIKTTHTYPNQTHKELIEYAKKEANSKIHPKIVSKIPNFEDLDVVFVGYPNWWYDMPMVIYTLFSEYDFKGKTIVPFCTHGGSGFSDSVETIKRLEKNATVISMPPISRTNAANSRNGIIKWLQDNNFTPKPNK